MQMLEEFYPIRWWIFASLGLFVMACVSLIFCFNVLQTSIAMMKFLILPTLLTCMFYLVFRRLDESEISFSLIVLGGIFFLHSIVTIFVYLWSGNPWSVGIGNHSIIPYTIFLLLSFSIALAILVYTRYKLLSIILIAISLFALYANGTRASILSVGVMIMCAVLYPKYRYKKWNVSLLFLAMFGGGVALLEWSEKQNARFNFKAIIERIGVVWSYAPAEMGRFDELCFAPNLGYRCSPYSGETLDSRFSFESSALYRLLLAKSAIYAIKKNPLIPKGFHALTYDINLPKEFQARFYPYLQNHDGLRFYQHVHNGFLSAFFEMGIIGGFLYCLFFLILFFYGLKNKSFFGCILSCFVVGSIVQNLLEVSFAYAEIIYVFSSSIGILLGRIFAQEKKNENCI